MNLLQLVTHRASRRVAALSLLAPWAFAGHPALAEAATPLAFDGVELGTPLAAWRGLKPPGPVSAHVRRACSDDPAGKDLGARAPDLPSDAVVCGYVDAYGAYRLPVTFRWDRQFQMEHLRYVFRAGVLTEVRARVSDDAFDAVTAKFKATYGPPAQVVREKVPSEIGPLPRVRLIWTPPGGRVEVVDPSARPNWLSIRLSERPDEPAFQRTAQR